MKRLAMQELISWKNKPGIKPLLIRGARQVGKTWLIKEFGKNDYDQTVCINFVSAKMLQSLFIEDFNIQQIINGLQIHSGVKITPRNTNLFTQSGFDKEKL